MMSAIIITIILFITERVHGSQGCQVQSEEQYTMFNVVQQNGMIELDYFFSGKALIYDTNLNQTNYTIVQAISNILNLTNSLNGNIIAIAQIPIIETTKKLIYSIAILTSDNTAYQIQQFQFFPNNASISEIRQFSNEIPSQYNCINLQYISAEKVLIQCFNLNLTQILYLIDTSTNDIQQITTQQQLDNNSMLKYKWMYFIVHTNQLFTAFSNYQDYFVVFSYQINQYNFTYLGSQEINSLVSGFYVTQSSNYFMMVDEQLLYSSNGNETNLVNIINVENPVGLGISESQTLNQLPLYHIAILNNEKLTTIILEISTIQITQQYSQQYFNNDTITQQPSIFINQDYVIIQTELDIQGYSFTNFFMISPLWYLQQSQSYLQFQSIFNNIIIINSSSLGLYKLNKAVLITQANKNIDLSFKIKAKSINAEECQKQINWFSYPNQYSPIQQLFDCNTLQLSLSNPEIVPILIEKCSVGPNITYYGGSYLNIKNQELDFQNLTINQLDQVFYFNNNNNSIYQTFLVNPQNTNNYLQIFQTSNYKVLFENCNQWICQKINLILNLNYQLELMALGTVYQDQDNLYLATNGENLAIQIYLINNESITNYFNISLDQYVNIQPTTIVSQIEFLGQYLYIITDNPQQLLIFDVNGFQLIEDSKKYSFFKPRQIYTNFEFYGNKIFLDNSESLIEFMIVDKQILILSEKTYILQNSQVAVGLLKQGIYIAEASTEQYSTLVYYSTIQEQLVTQIPLYDNNFTIPLISSFSSQFLYLQSNNIDGTYQLQIFKDNKYLIYQSLYLDSSILNLNVVALQTIFKYDIIMMNTQQKQIAYNNYWNIQLIINTNKILANQVTMTEQVYGIASNSDQLQEYSFEFPVTINDQFYQIKQFQNYSPITTESNQIYINMNPLEYFQGSLLYYTIYSKGQQTASINSNLINDTNIILPCNAISSATMNQNESILLIQDQQYIYSLQLPNSNQFQTLYQINITQYSKCPIIFFDFYSQYPVSLCTNETDTYIIYQANKIQYYSFQQLMNNSQPNLQQAIYMNGILILQFLQNGCQLIEYYLFLITDLIQIQQLSSILNCNYVVSEMQPLNITLGINILQQTENQCFGWIGIASQYGFIPYSQGCYNMPSTLQNSTPYLVQQGLQDSQIYTLFIESVISDQLQLIKILQINYPKQQVDYTLLQILLQSINSGLVISLKYQNSNFKIDKNIKTLQGLNYQNAINSAIQGELILTQYYSKIGSQTILNTCLYQPISDQLLVQFAYCKEIFYVTPPHYDFTPFMFLFNNGYLLINNYLLKVSFNLQLTVYPYLTSESQVYVNASNLQSWANLEIEINQIQPDKIYWGWIIFGIIGSLSILILIGYQVLQKRLQRGQGQGQGQGEYLEL